jgi:hypothetical protein
MNPIHNIMICETTDSLMMTRLGNLNRNSCFLSSNFLVSTLNVDVSVFFLQRVLLLIDFSGMPLLGWKAKNE